MCNDLGITLTHFFLVLILVPLHVAPTVIVPTQEMRATDSSMGTLGAERLPGRLYCDIILCYGHLAMPVAWRILFFSSSPSFLF